MSIYIEMLFDNQDIYCTDKCFKALDSDTEIKGHERQFCLLLKSDDVMSRNLGRKMLNKVNLNYLLSNGYIKINQDSKIFQDSIQRIEENGGLLELQEKKETPKLDLDDDIDPILKLVSGNI